MFRTRTTTRLASALALLAVLVRVLMPALHTHGDHHHTGLSTQIAGHATTCSCGAVHAPPVDDHDGERCTDGETSVAAHACLACEIEASTPCDSATTLRWPGILGATTDAARVVLGRTVVSDLILLTQPRGPPSDEA